MKLIHPHLGERTDFVAAFRREAELSALLAHPNVVQVLDFGPGQDSFFVAMEFVDGLTLDALMACCQFGAAHEYLHKHDIGAGHQRGQWCGENFCRSNV